MNYLLDTNAISDLTAENSVMLARMSSLGPADRVLTCAIVRGEVLYGLGRLPHGKRRAALERKTAEVLRSLPCDAVPPSAGDEYATVKLNRERVGRPLDENDCWIAATALALSAVLVSRDSDFAGIEGLSVEDWSK